jgi:hypothetical protein
MSGALVLVLEFIAPLVALIVYGRIKIARARRKAAAAELAGVGPTPLALEPKPEPALNFFMRRFSLPQRAYLRQQIATGKVFYYIAAWAFIVFFTSGLLPQYVNRYGLEQPLAQRVWYSYLLHDIVIGVVFGVMMLMAALVTVVGLVDPSQAIFTRTRPLTLNFLFWARILPAVGTILASLATGMIVSFVLLLVFYGPVWTHLQDTTSKVVLNHEQAFHLNQILHTSLPRIFLSLVTTALLIFSTAAALFSQPFVLSRNRGGFSTLRLLPICGGAFVVPAIHFLGSAFFARWSPELFIYAFLGPPPPYVFACVPILASAGLLLIAGRMIRRVEP